LAEADGNRTRLTGMPGHNGFEDRARHQTRYASTDTLEVAETGWRHVSRHALALGVTDRREPWACLAHRDGLWLMYLVFATVLDVVNGYDWPKA
jgi:hypothetical protein